MSTGPGFRAPGQAWRPEPQDERVFQPAVETTASELRATTVAEFLALLRLLQVRSGVKRHAFVARTGIPSSTLYNFFSEKYTKLPSTSAQVVAIARGSGLTESQCRHVVALWTELQIPSTASQAASGRAAVTGTGMVDLTVNGARVGRLKYEPGGDQNVEVRRVRNTLRMVVPLLVVGLTLALMMIAAILMLLQVPVPSPWAVGIAVSAAMLITLVLLLHFTRLHTAPGVAPPSRSMLGNFASWLDSKRAASRP